MARHRGSHSPIKRVVAPSSATPDNASAKPIIKVEQLCKSFGDNLVLDHVDLQIRPGESLSIVGPSGCGKTVLAKHFNGLLFADSGQVTVCGRDLATASDDQLDEVRRQTGYVFQGNALFASDISLNVYENVSLALRVDPYDRPAGNESQIRARVEDVLKEVGMGSEYLDRMPSELSGGQKKRVAVARAIIANPPIMIYDEPTTGLDPEATGMVIDLIETLYHDNGNTTIAITHEPRLMERLGRVVFVRDRQVYFDGPFIAFAASKDPVIVHFLSEGPNGRRSPRIWGRSA